MQSESKGQCISPLMLTSEVSQHVKLYKLITKEIVLNVCQTGTRTTSN